MWVGGWGGRIEVAGQRGREENMDRRRKKGPVCVSMYISIAVHSFLITCVFTTVQMTHKGVFSEKDRIGVGLLFLYPELQQIMKSVCWSAALQNCLTTLITSNVE